MEQKKNAIRPVFENLRKLALYTGVSLGALALSGCSVKEEYDPYATDVLKQDYAEMVSYPVTIYASNYEELEEKDHLFLGMISLFIIPLKLIVLWKKHQP